MMINNVNTNNQNTMFRAKFLHSDSLKSIANYAVEHGKFDKLNEARKKIDTAFLTTRLLVDIGENNGVPFIAFTKYIPKSGVVVPKSIQDYGNVKTTTYVSSKRENLLKFALNKIIKLSNGAPSNNMYKKVVITNR